MLAMINKTTHNTTDVHDSVKNPHKGTYDMFGGFRLMLFLSIWCFMHENVLKVFLKLF